MKPFYLKGSYKGYPSFAMVIIRGKIVKADIICYDQTANTWHPDRDKFDLRINDEIRGYNNFKEHFFESTEKEYNSARKFLLNLPPKTVLPLEPVDPIISMEELTERIRQFEEARKKNNGDKASD